MRQLRQAKRVSLTEMAKRISYSKSYLSGVENCSVKPSPNLIHLYEQALGAEIMNPNPDSHQVLLDTPAFSQQTDQDNPDLHEKKRIIWDGEKDISTSSTRLEDDTPRRNFIPFHVNETRHIATWRELLGTIISDAKKRQHLTNALDVTSITLTRWVTGETEPRQQNLRHLLTVLPQYRERFIELLREERGPGEFIDPATDEMSGEIPSEFYARIFADLATMPDNLRTWSICQFVLQHVQTQLDPYQTEIATWVITCMPPSGPSQRVRSLRVHSTNRNTLWLPKLDQHTMFYGTESLAGDVVTCCRPLVIQSLDHEPEHRRLSQTLYEKSTAIYPILYMGRFAGVFGVSSTHYNYFRNPSLVTLVQRYSELLALAFQPEDFYTPEEITLYVLPPLEEQKQFLARFPRYFANATEERSKPEERSQQAPLNVTQANLVAWQQIEEQLLQRYQYET